MNTHFDGSPQENDLPTAWSQAVIEDKSYMFGFGGSASYAFFVTDMESVWADTPSTENVFKIALQKGITGFDEEKFQVLKSNLKDIFRTTPADVLISSVSSSAVSAQVKISDNLTWSFDASLCDAETAAKFFGHLCRQSFSNHGYSVYRGFQLEKAIRMKDEYIVYLEENYRTLNGTELMKKFRRQNPEFEKKILEFSSTNFDTNVADDYLQYLEAVSTNDPRSRVWKELSLVKKDQTTWMDRLQKMKSLPDPNTDLQLKHDDVSVAKSGKRRRSGGEENFEGILKIEPTPVPAKKRPSPSKRRRLGFIGRR